MGALNHIAIAVPNLEGASKLFQRAFGAEISDPQPEPEHGVTVVFVSLPNTKIELLEPLGENSPIQKFLEKNPNGGIHHFCIEVDDLEKAMNRAKSKGVRVLGEGKPKTGAHGKPVIFLHPKDCLGTLIEFEEK